MSIGKDVSRRLSAALPPPHEGEPASLRQDILDELADHLACAYRRELLRTHGDTELTRGNVRERFGDPARLARKLWFDAMRGRLMAQKLMLAMTGLCVLVAGAIAYLGWRQLEASQEVNRQLISSQQEANTALLERLEGLSLQPKESPTPSLEWNSIEFTVVEEGTGKPVRDIKAEITGPSGESAYTQHLTDLRPNDDGVIRIAHAFMGNYTVSLTHPLGYSAQESITVLPGIGFKKTYHVPRAIQQHQYQLHVNWPVRLRQRMMWAIVSFKHSGQYNADELIWRAHPMNSPSPEQFVAVSTKGEIINLGPKYSSQLDVHSTAFGEANIDQRLASSVNGVHGHDYGKTAARILSPAILGLYPGEQLPSDWEDVKQKSWWVTISPDLMANPTPLDDTMFLSSDPVQTVAPNSAVVMSQSVFRYPTQELELEIGKTNIFKIEIPEIVANSIPEDQLPPISPVEARRPSFRVPVTIRCTQNEAPIVGATVQLLATRGVRDEVPDYAEAYSPSDGFGSLNSGVNAKFVKVFKDGREVFVPVYDGGTATATAYALPSDPGPFTSTGEFASPVESTIETDGDGNVRFESMPPGEYRVHVTMPAGEVSDEMYVRIPNDGQPVERTIECPPAEPETAYDIFWPSVAKNRSDLWLVMELNARLQKQAGGGTWNSHRWHLIAINPEGRTIVWNEHGGATDIRYRALASKWKDGLLDHLLMLWNKQQLDSPRLPSNLSNDKFRILGVGIARWDGSGSPGELLHGMRDGRYIDTTCGAYFYALRHVAPMKSVDTLPILVRKYSPTNGFKTQYQVPESLVRSALSRWETLPDLSTAVTAR